MFWWREFATTYSKFNHIWAQVKSTMKIDRSQLLTDPHLCSSPQSSPALAALTHRRTHVEFHVVAHDAPRGLHRRLLVGPQSPACCYSPQSLALHAVAAPACCPPRSPRAARRNRTSLLMSNELSTFPHSINGALRNNNNASEAKRRRREICHCSDGKRKLDWSTLNNFGQLQ